MRLYNDLTEFKRYYTQPEECFTRVGEPTAKNDCLRLEITIYITGSGPFRGVTFFYEAHFTKQYPYQPPKVFLLRYNKGVAHARREIEKAESNLFQFIQKQSDGSHRVVLPALDNDWKPTMSLSMIILALEMFSREAPFPTVPQHDSMQVD